MAQLQRIPDQLRVAAVFTSHMVLQRDKELRIFGEGISGTCVQVTLIHGDGSGIAAAAPVEEYRWCVTLPPQQADMDCTLTVTDGDTTLSFSDVAIGEVWLAGGQSNMEFALRDCAGGPEALQSPPDLQLRFYGVPRNAYKTEAYYKDEDHTCWQTFSGSASGDWSAVGYYFARKLQQALPGVCIGIIGCNLGGTSASAWMSREALLEDPDTATYVAELDAASRGVPVEEQERQYDEYLAYHTQWDKKCAQLYRDDPNITWAQVQQLLGPCRYPGPINCKSPFRPAGLYECMLRRITPCAIRGVIYYQGESDDHKPTIYGKLLTRLIRQWREDFQDPDLPFIITQLTMHRYVQDPDWKNWCLIREAQMEVSQSLPHTGIAVIIDQGEFNNIHPLRKDAVGQRLALQALWSVYQLLPPEAAFGPIYDSCRFQGSAAHISLRYAQEGFLTCAPEITGFELAGSDGCYHAAYAEIRNSQIRLTSPEVAHPVSARYLWTNYAEVTLFGSNGIPVAPFRTDRI